MIGCRSRSGLGSADLFGSAGSILRTDAKARGKYSFATPNNQNGKTHSEKNDTLGPMIEKLFDLPLRSPNTPVATLAIREKNAPDAG